MRIIRLSAAVATILLGFAGIAQTEDRDVCVTEEKRPQGKLVIDVTQHFVNGIAYESYYADPINVDVWAMEEARKHTKVWQVGADSLGPIYLAEVTYEGSFVTVAGHSPAEKNIPLALGIKGHLKGRYLTNRFHGVLNPHPAWKTRGYLGEIDFACDPATGNCPGFVSWPEVYFVTEPADWNYATYDFEYSTGRHGTFVQHLWSFEGNITTECDPER